MSMCFYRPVTVLDLDRYTWEVWYSLITKNLAQPLVYKNTIISAAYIMYIKEESINTCRANFRNLTSFQIESTKNRAGESFWNSIINWSFLF